MSRRNLSGGKISDAAGAPNAKESSPSPFPTATEAGDGRDLSVTAHRRMIQPSHSTTDEHTESTGTASRRQRDNGPRIHPVSRCLQQPRESLLCFVGEEVVQWLTDPLETVTDDEGDGEAGSAPEPIYEELSDNRWSPFYSASARSPSPMTATEEHRAVHATETETGLLPNHRVVMASTTHMFPHRGGDSALASATVTHAHQCAPSLTVHARSPSLDRPSSAGGCVGRASRASVDSVTSACSSVSLSSAESTRVYLNLEGDSSTSSNCAFGYSAHREQRSVTPLGTSTATDASARMSHIYESIDDAMAGLANSSRTQSREIRALTLVEASIPPAPADAVARSVSGRHRARRESTPMWQEGRDVLDGRSGERNHRIHRLRQWQQAVRHTPTLRIQHCVF